MLAIASQPCDITLHTALQDKSIVCSGSRFMSSTVLRWHGYNNWSKINVKSSAKCTCSYVYIQRERKADIYNIICLKIFVIERNRQTDVTLNFHRFIHQGMFSNCPQWHFFQAEQSCLQHCTTSLARVRCL